MVAEHQAALEELKKDETLAKDLLKLQEAIEQKWPVYQRNMVSVHCSVWEVLLQRKQGSI